MIRFLCLITVMFVSTMAWAQVTTVHLDGWSGGWCAMPCGTGGVGNYDCSNGHGGWTPKVNFTDTVPAGHVVTKIASNVFTANCAASSTVTTSINGTMIGSATRVGYDCQCNYDCKGMSATSTTYPNGFPGYVYGGANTFSLAVSGLLCVSYATLTIESVLAETLTVTVVAAKSVVEPDLPIRRKISQNGSEQTPVMITVTDAKGVPVTGANVALAVERVSVGFGGHDHDAGLTTSSSTRPMGTVTIPTDNGNGTYTATYTASEFSSQDKIVATVTSGTGSGTGMSGTIIARVPGLFKYNVFAPHLSIGGTKKHHGPNDKKNPVAPDNNHWGTALSNAKLYKLSQLYYAQFGGGLQINDMSLPKGGRFDVFGKWTGSHTTHRRGIDVDMRLVDKNPSNLPKRKVQPVIYNIKDIKKGNPGIYRSADIHNNNHIHVSF